MAMTADVLFSCLSAGLQTDGSVIAELGWESFAITEATGIEPFIGISGFANELQFMEWMKAAINSDLADWEPYSLELFNCWLPPICEQYLHLQDHDEPLFCYSVWRVEPDPGSIKVNKVKVFAIKHKASPLLEHRRVKAFHCARQRSYAEATWLKKSPSISFSPQIMYDMTSTGFYLTGIKAEDKTESHLSWPTSDLVATLALAKEFSEQGIRNIHLCEGDMGYELNKLTSIQEKRLIEKYHHYGEEALLFDLALS